jgi:hypothetical protein
MGRGDVPAVVLASHETVRWDAGIVEADDVLVAKFVGFSLLCALSIYSGCVVMPGYEAPIMNQDTFWWRLPLGSVTAMVQ